MNYEVKIKPDHILVLCSEPFLSSDLMQSYRAGITAAVQNEFSKILIDVRNVTGEATIMERFDTSKYLVNQIQEQGFRGKVAVLGNEPLIDHSRFGETVAKNRGVLGKATTDFDDALNWLEL